MPGVGATVVEGMLPHKDWCESYWPILVVRTDALKSWPIEIQSKIDLRA